MEMKPVIKRIAILSLALWPGLVIAIEDTGLIREQTCDPRITAIRYNFRGEGGQAHVVGPEVPDGEIWVVEAAGVSTDDGGFIEWMLQIYMFVTNTDGSQSYRLIPLHRHNGFAAGTPVLAMDRRVILRAGTTLSARANGLSADKTMGLLFYGWAIPDYYLSRLLGLPKQATSAQELAIEQLSLEKSLQ